jgi:hypothetical protein
VALRIHLLQNVHLTDCSDPKFSVSCDKGTYCNVTNNFTVCAFPIGVYFGVCFRNRRLHICVAKKCKLSVPFLPFLLVSWCGVRLSPFGTLASVWLAVPAPIDDNESGAVDEMRIGRRNRSTRRKPTPAPLSPPQISHDLTWARTLAAAVGSQRLTP